MAYDNLTEFNTQAEYEANQMHLKYPNVSKIGSGNGVIKYTKECPPNLYDEIFATIGYDSAPDVARKYPIDEVAEQVAYSKILYDAWDSSTTNTSDLYASDFKLIYAPKIDTSNVTIMGEIKEVPPDWGGPLPYSGMFRFCEQLTTVPELDASKVTDMTAVFEKCSKLTTFGGFIGLKVFLSFKWNLFGRRGSCPLTHDSIMNVINCAADVTSNPQILEFGNSNLAKITDDEKAIAINKGWTLR